jgi:hypothetical protein
MLCVGCGNQIIRCCGPVCLVCEHTGRGAAERSPEAKDARGRLAQASFLAVTQIWLDPVPAEIRELSK